MYTYLVRLCAVILVVGFAGVRTEVTVENKGYKNILVSFSPTVSTENGRSLIEDMQNVLNDASGVLLKAIGLRISQVTFLLPSSWDTSEWENITIGFSSLTQKISTVDILVDGITDSAFGKRPHAIQYGGCGVPGNKISFPEKYLEEDSPYPKGKIIAREWLKYRYGVFDENGFRGDKLYPVYYKVPGTESSDIEINDCTNNPLQYNFRDGKGNNCVLKYNERTGFPVYENDGCLILPDEQSVKNVTSSLMYFKDDLPDMEHICGSPEHPHNTMAPSKHNTLCQGKSIWEVLKRSPDFPAEGDSEGEEEIVFTYVQERKPRVVIAWENTVNLKAKERVILKTIAKFMYDLPNGSKYGLYPYNKNKNDQIDLKELNDWPRNREVSVSSDFYSPEAACTTCAISKAIDAFVRDSGAQDASQETGSVIVITASDSSVDDELMQKIKNSPLCLIVFAFTDQTENLDQLVASSVCGSSWNASIESEEKVLFEEMSYALESVLPRNSDNTVTKTVKTDYLQHGSNMTIPVDRTVANVTLWLTQKCDPDYIQCKTKEGNVEMSQVFNSDSLTILYYNPEKKEDLNCSFLHHTIPKTLTQVRVISKPGEYFESQVWVKDTTEKSDNSQMPVIIYANLNFGPYPVKNAEVKASVTLPDGTVQPVDLFDDGRGDPDITEGDGTYSRYFTEFTSDGLYTVIIRATDNGGQAKASRNALQQCCGSSIRNNDDIDLDEFEEIFEAAFQVKSKKPEAGYRPSRITDLRIVDFNTSSVVLEWTAPGGEADTGKAEKYFIKFYTSEEEAIQSFEASTSTSTFNLSIEPQERGNVERYAVEFSDDIQTNTTYFIGMISMNSYKKNSELSNIIKVFVPEQTEVTTDGGSTTQSPNDQALRKAQANKRLIGIIIGVVVLVIILIICAYALVYIFIIKPKRKEEKEKRKSNSSNERDKNISLENRSINPLHSVRADIILQHHNEIVKAKNEHKNPPVLKEDDFQTQNAEQTDSNNENNNANHAEYSQVVPKKVQEAKDQQPTPPKSPKRMTFV